MKKKLVSKEPKCSILTIRHTACILHGLGSQSAAVPTSMLEALILRRGFPAQYYAFSLWLTAPISKNEI